MRFTTALLVLVALVALAPRLLDPQTWILAQAVLRLGPVSGWRCAESSTYVYDPAQDQVDSTLLSDPPEDQVLSRVPWFEVDQVEANLRGGDTLVSVRSASSDGAEERRVYVLSPGKLQAVNVVLLGGEATLCNAHLGNWQIVGEQELG